MLYDPFSQAFLSMLENPVKVILLAMVLGSLLGAIRGIRIRS